MSTAIQWTDETWNPVVGCTQVSPGCANCYAKQQHDKRHRAFRAGRLQNVPQYAHPFEVVQLKPERLVQPFSIRAPKRIFVNSVADLFHDDVPARYIAEVFAVMAMAERHTYQVLTKRPSRMRALLASDAFLDDVLDAAEGLWHLTRRDDDPIDGWNAHVIEHWPLSNIWLGVSVENQRFADERIPLLLDTPAAVRFLSCEPLLGPVELTSIAERVGESSRVTYSALVRHGRDQWRSQYIDWVILGGESGPKARPFDIRWAASLVAQCKAAGVPVFVKQLGDVPMEPLEDWRGRSTTRLLKASNQSRTPDGFVPLHLGGSHGSVMENWPVELQVREFPIAGGAR